MSRWRVIALAGSLAIGGVAVAAGPAAASPGAAPGAPTHRAACGAVPRGYATCLAELLVPAPAQGRRQPAIAGGAFRRQSTTPSGLSPAQIKGAYGFPTTGGSGQTIALVDAFDDPTIAGNLTTFSSEYGLPACTASNGCFTKVNQDGGTTYPAATSGWDLEISLDVEWVHAIAPYAHILLVEASSNSDTNLFAAVNYAAQHARYVSMSWGGTETPLITSFDSTFTGTPTVGFFAASGDSAAAVIYPSASPYVVSVGGTTLTVTKTADKWVSESAWSTAGGGCSAYETASPAQRAYPTYDQSGATCAGHRATPDVSLDANPSTGVAVYDSRPVTGLVGWITVGGTSASTAMVAGRAAASAAHVDATTLYGGKLSLYNVTTGSNGHPCETGYNLCTGLGSWNTAVGAVATQPAGALSFASPAQTLAAGSPSEPMTIALSAGAPAGGLTVALSTSSSGGGFSTSASGSYGHSLTLHAAAGSTASPAFYYEDTKAGSPVLTASATGWTSATQTETVDAGPLARVVVSPPSATIAEGATQAYTATGYDRYTNSVAVRPSWTSTVTGTFSPATGASTTFTAGQTAGSGTVVATTTTTTTAGSLKGAASLTVTATPTLKVTVTAGAARKTKRGYQVPITVDVAGSAGAVSGANVSLDVRSASCSGSVVATGSGTTGSSGTAHFTFTTRSTGSYCAAATATASGYDPGSATATFSVAASGKTRSAVSRTSTGSVEVTGRR